MVKYVFCNDMFHNFTTDTSERDWSVICCLYFSPFLYAGATFACFQSDGMQPVWSDFWKIVVKIGAVKFWRFFSILLLMLSGPLALCGLMLLSSFWMPGVVMANDGIPGCELTPLFGMLSIDSVVNTDWNCSLKMLPFDQCWQLVVPLFSREQLHTVVSSWWLTEGQEFFRFRLVIKTLVWIICWKV